MSLKDRVVTEAGFTVVYDSKGRRRKHWKVPLRKQARKFKKDFCEDCGLKENRFLERNKMYKLTIHHVPPLSKSLETEKYVTLCRVCHDKREKRKES